MLRSILTTTAEILGLGLLAAGAGAIFWPAALIVAGVGLIVMGVMQA